MIDVYWSFNALGGNSDLIVEKPMNPLVDLKKNNYFVGIEMVNYSKCTSLPHYFKNVFVVKAISDFTLKRQLNSDGEYVITTDKSQEFFDNIFEINTYEKEQQVIKMSWFWFFFSEKSVDVRGMPAFLHENDFTKNTTFLPGLMDISKWFRPIHPAFKMNTSEINVKRGDALFYLHFNTDEKIKLKHFEMSESINNYSSGCLHVKKFADKLSLKRLYELFTKRNYNKKIMKEIKKNLTGDFE